MNLLSNNQLKTMLIFVSIYVCTLAIHAQTSEKLPATNIIGTAVSVNYDTNAPSTTVNTKENAFDGKLDTYFASYERSGTWVGLDLGEKHIITKVAYAPRNDQIGPGRIVLGMFEGANNPDFSDAIPLLMVTEAPPLGRMTEQDIYCSRGFRYVRYVGPNDVRCNVAEVAFYGYKGAGNNTRLHQLTNLPTIVISTVNAAEIVSKDVFRNGFISIINNDSIYSDLLEIRGRGHASWGFPKKPYRIKFRNKVNLFGFPAKARTWTLINNWGDKTFMRNLLAFNISKRIEMDFTPAAIPVDLILNGEYKGTYVLCDQIEINTGRVDVQEMTANDLTLPNLSGGYLLEVDAYASQEPSGWFTSSRQRTPVRVRSPKADEIRSQQFSYIWNHYNKMEDAVFAYNYQDPINGYRKYIDTESFIRQFLVGEISGNTDTYWSTYMYKERDSDIFKFGPVWDIDLGFDNDNRTYPINSHSDWCYEYGSTANGFRAVVRNLLTDPYFVSELRYIYANYRKSGALTKNELLQTADEYANLISQSQRLNFMRWDILTASVHQNPRVWGSYQGEVDNVKRYLAERIDWLDKKMGYSEVDNTFITSDLPPVMVYTQTNAICFSNFLRPVSVMIVDVTGRTIFTNILQDDIQVAVSKGVYFITISDSKGLHTTQKRIVY